MQIFKTENTWLDGFVIYKVKDISFCAVHDEELKLWPWSIYLMVAQAEWSTYTTVSSVARLTSRNNYPNGQLSKETIESIHE